jgi:negative regulator of flagellin synthesis FlgM
MTIEINNLPPVNPGSAETGNSSGVKRNDPQAGGGAGPGAPAGGADQVSLTPTARILRDLETRIADLPEVDRDRVRDIKEAIASGRYEIDADRVAARLMDMERALKDIG